MTEYRTDCDGWAAVWRLDHTCIRMIRIGTSTPGRTPLISVHFPAVATDLVTAREQFPSLSRLWDAVRQDYWRHLPEALARRAS